MLTKVGSWIEKFQSTPSARRATHTGHHAGCAIDISIHALREEGDYEALARGGSRYRISIHALREEGDAEQRTSRATLPGISIHALREEGDRQLHQQ